ncbi:MAG: oxaloacetate decarboxylase [Candidatus Lambdaproteobacteria bacterium]|nr:oxaloacetate decarboxylase [Candidatus Lambdaproteobacteria bacterium]
MDTPAAALRARLGRPGLILAPGCYDAFSARLIERAGFEAAYMTGFGASASRLGMPDAGLMTFSEMVGTAGDIAAALGIPLIADADTGYGNPINVHRTVRSYARAGVAAIQLEDQEAPKKCGHTPGKRVIPAGDMVQKLRAAADARAERDIVVIARTDARASEGFAAALERCRAYEQAGADVIFLEAPESEAELAAVAQAIRAPLFANMVEGGKTPILPAARLEALGYRIAIYPVSLLTASAKAMQGVLDRLRRETVNRGGPDQVSFDELKELVGFPDYYRMERRYGG